MTANKVHKKFSELDHETVEIFFQKNHLFYIYGR